MEDSASLSGLKRAITLTLAVLSPIEAAVVFAPPPAAVSGGQSIF